MSALSESVNATACTYWLTQLRTTCQALPLLGEPAAALQEMAELYGAAPCPLDYFAEMRLLGTPGVDLSAQYPASLFLGQKKTATAAPPASPLQRQALLFWHYADALQAVAPQYLPQSYAYLEADTHAGEITGSSCFLDCDEKLAPQLLPQLLSSDGLATAAQLATLTDLLGSLPASLHLQHVGLMLAREQQPLRLTFYDDADLLTNLLSFSPVALPAPATELLQEIASLELFTLALNLDLLPAGQWGPTVGLELFPRALLPGEQQRLLHSASFNRFLLLLQKHGLADTRVLRLPACIWTQRDVPCLPDYCLFSLFSHAKLRWTNGVSQSAKVYLQMRSLPRQHSINETIPNLQPVN